jgi:hypothetical protein
MDIAALPSTAARVGEVSWLSNAKERRRSAKIDAEFADLAHASFNSVVGPIGFRSLEHPDAGHREWVQLDRFEQVAKVLCRPGVHLPSSGRLVGIR